MTIRRCSQRGCDRPVEARGLCKSHYERERLRKIEAAGRAARQHRPPIGLTGEPHIPCPPGCLELAAAVAELDAQAIFRVIWPHLPEIARGHALRVDEPEPA